MDAVIEVQIIGNDSYDSPDRCDCSSRDGFATDISSLPANSLEFFERGIKKRARKFYEMLNFPADGGEAIFTRFH